MALEHQFNYGLDVVFDAIEAAVKSLQKLRSADRATRVIGFTTRMSGWSWGGSQWRIRLGGDGQVTWAAAEMGTTSSLMAAKTGVPPIGEARQIQKIWEAAESIIARRVAAGVIEAPTPGELAASNEFISNLYGTVLADERFGGRRVRILSKGYVSISAAGGYQRLLSVEENFVIQKKSGVGRAAFAVATSGANLLTSNKRGNLYLSFVTDSGTTTLKEDPPTDSGVQRASALALAGRAAIEEAARSSSTPTSSLPAHPAPGVPERLAKAKELLDQGVITAEEYAASRAQIIQDL